MPRIVSDSVDVYLFRRVSGRVEFLALLRRPEVALGSTWNTLHTKIASGEKAYESALREMRQTLGIVPKHLYSADLIGQFYDHYSDAISLSPVFAALVEGPGPVILSPDYSDYAWCDLDEAVARLLSNAQRWAVRHIYDAIATAGAEAEFYRIQ